MSAAFVFGLFMGWLKVRTGGLLAPWLAHFLVDLVIVGYVLVCR